MCRTIYIVTTHTPVILKCILALQCSLFQNDGQPKDLTKGPAQGPTQNYTLSVVLSCLEKL